MPPAVERVSMKRRIFGLALVASLVLSMGAQTAVAGTRTVKGPVASWDSKKVKSAKKAVYAEGQLNPDGSLSVFVASFKPKKSPYSVTVPEKWYKTKGNWSLNFQLAPAHTVASGEYKPPELNSVTLGAGISNYSPNISDFGSVDLKTVSLKAGGALGGTVKIDDGYFTVNTSFKGKVAKVYPATPTS
jgi:hypothetical protein